MEILLLVVILVGAAILALILRGKPARPTGEATSTAQTPQEPPLDHAEKQLLALRGVALKPARLMNDSEFRLFRLVRDVCASRDPSLLVFAQVSMGAFINTEVRGAVARRAYNAFNAKRIDIGVFSGQAEPLLAIEFNGAGHSQGDAAKRDAVKAEALTQAGVPLVIITPEMSETDIRQMLGERLSPRTI
jgi:hypothetical protein